MGQSHSESCTFILALCKSAFLLMRFFGLFAYQKRATMSSTTFLRVLDRSLTVWSVVLVTGTSVHAAVSLAAFKLLEKPKTPSELVKLTGQCVYSICLPILAITAARAFANFEAVLENYKPICKRYLSKGNFRTLMYILGLLCGTFMLYLYPSIDTSISTFKTSDTLLGVKVTSTPTVQLVHHLAFVANRLCDGVTALAQSILTVLCVSISFCFENISRKYGTADSDATEKHFSDFRELCCIVKQLKNKFAYWLFCLYMKDFAWALYSIHLMNQSVTFLTYFVGMLLFITLRTTAFLMLLNKAEMTKDAMATCIIGTAYGNRKKDIALRLRILTREFVGLSTGLININREFVLGGVGVFITYVMLSWETKDDSDEKGLLMCNISSSR